MALPEGVVALLPQALRLGQRSLRDALLPLLLLLPSGLPLPLALQAALARRRVLARLPELPLRVLEGEARPALDARLGACGLPARHLLQPLQLLLAEARRARLHQATELRRGIVQELDFEVLGGGLVGEHAEVAARRLLLVHGDRRLEARVVQRGEREQRWEVVEATFALRGRQVLEQLLCLGAVFLADTPGAQDLLRVHQAAQRHGIRRLGQPVHDLHLGPGAA
mmetsp:Transcript_34291/g.101884  ORF Transcript_34291/g.101884 Transcript_34291/m.101884 type:complete len:225 (+) Transcript_34291:1566-2240(+)